MKEFWKSFPLANNFLIDKYIYNSNPQKHRYILCKKPRKKLEGYTSPLTKFTQRKKSCKINEISLINKFWEDKKEGCNCDLKANQKKLSYTINLLKYFIVNSFFNRFPY